MTYTISPIQAKKLLAAATGAIHEPRAQRHGFGSRLSLEYVDRALRLSASPSSLDRQRGQADCSYWQAAISRNLMWKYGPLEGRARAALGLGFAYRMAQL